MNTKEHINLIPADPLVKRLDSFEERVAKLEKENRDLRHQQPEARYVTRENACRQLSCRYTKLHELLKEGLIESFKAGRRTLIKQDSIDRYLAHCQKK